MAYLYLAIAIISEVIATSFLKAAEGFTVLLPTAGVVVFYGLSFYFLSMSLQQIPLGVAYAVWAGLGIVLISVAGWLFYHQSLDLAALAGVGLIIAGVAVIKLFSHAV